PLEFRHGVRSAPGAGQKRQEDGELVGVGGAGEILEGLPRRLGTRERKVQELKLSIVPMASIFFRSRFSAVLEKHLFSAELEKRRKRAFCNFVAVGPSMNGNVNVAPVARFIANTWSCRCTPAMRVSPEDSAPYGACTGSFELTTSAGR